MACVLDCGGADRWGGFLHQPEGYRGLIPGPRNLVLAWARLGPRGRGPSVPSGTPGLFLSFGGDPDCFMGEVFLCGAGLLVDRYIFCMGPDCWENSIILLIT